MSIVDILRRREEESKRYLKKVHIAGFDGFTKCGYYYAHVNNNVVENKDRMRVGADLCKRCEMAANAEVNEVLHLISLKDSELTLCNKGAWRLQSTLKLPWRRHDQERLCKNCVAASKKELTPREQSDSMEE